MAVVAHATAKQARTSGRLVCQITDDPNATTIDAGTERRRASASPHRPRRRSQPTLGTNRVFDVVSRREHVRPDVRGDGARRLANRRVTIHYRSMSATFTPHG